MCVFIVFGVGCVVAALWDLCVTVQDALRDRQFQRKCDLRMAELQRFIEDRQREVAEIRRQILAIEREHGQ